jgi:GxxExxY protein
MPIDAAISIPNISMEAFDEIDRVVMGCAFASQNYLGRLCEERVYETDLADRIRAQGFADVWTQVPLWARHADFAKEYRLDVVVNGAVFELKTVEAFTPRHDSQVYHYAMMLGVNHVKLLNFRTPKVTGLLRYNAVLPANRRDPVWNLTDWRPNGDACDALLRRMQDLVADWGTHLDSHLYQEALIHAFGGDVGCRKKVDVCRDDLRLGSHEVLSHGPGLIFTVTSFPDPAPQISHYSRLLRITGQTTLQWINVSKNKFTLTTVQN